MKKRKFKERAKKVFALLLAFMVIGGYSAFFEEAGNEASAAGYSLKIYADGDKEDCRVWYKAGGKKRTQTIRKAKFTKDGQVSVSYAYCIEPVKNTPAGTYSDNVSALKEDSKLSKALYYAPGYPGYEGFKSKYKSTSGYSGFYGHLKRYTKGGGVGGSVGEFRANYMAAHFALSYIYNGYSSFPGHFTKSDKAYIKRLANAMLAAPAPSFKGHVSFSPIMSSLDVNTLRTESFTASVKGGPAKLEVPEGLALVNETKGETVAGKNTALLSDGDKFFFRAASFEYASQKYRLSASLSGSSYSPYKMSPAKKQAVAFMGIADGETTSIQIKGSDIKFYIRLKKTDEKSGEPVRIPGVTFEVKDAEGKTVETADNKEVFTTDETGLTEESEWFDSGRFKFPLTATETKAPGGWEKAPPMTITDSMLVNALDIKDTEEEQPPEEVPEFYINHKGDAHKMKEGITWREFLDDEELNPKQGDAKEFTSKEKEGETFIYYENEPLFKEGKAVTAEDPVEAGAVYTCEASEDEPEQDAEKDFRYFFTVNGADIKCGDDADDEWNSLTFGEFIASDFNKDEEGKPYLSVKEEKPAPAENTGNAENGEGEGEGENPEDPAEPEPSEKVIYDGKEIKGVKPGDKIVLEKKYETEGYDADEVIKDENGDDVPPYIPPEEGETGDALPSWMNKYADKVIKDGDVFYIPFMEKRITANPKIKTSAAGAGGKSYITPSKEAVIIDEVSYEDLEAKTEYTLKGILMDKETGKALTDGDGNEIRGEKTFTTEDREGYAPGIDHKPFVSGKESVEFSLDAENLTGKSIVVFESLYKEDNIVAEHKDMEDKDQTVRVPGIKTKASDSVTGEGISHAEGKVTIEDEVSFKGLEAGKEYEIKGYLVDKDTGEKVMSEGKPVTAETSFVPEKSEGKATLSFTFDAGALKAKTAVAFEELSFEGKVIAEHKDINDPDQTVYFPGVKTKAKAVNSGENVMMAGPAAVFTDTVKYENLIKGREYTLTGTLMDKDTGKALKDPDGKEIKAEESFTAKAASGERTLTFTVNAESLKRHTIVVFEEITLEGNPVGSHKDINDEAQSVHIPDIGTKASVSGHKVKDEVRYDNLAVGLEYVMRGVLMDKDTGKPVMKGGKEVKAKESFTPKKSSGSVILEFDAKGLEGKTLVVFESCFLAKGDTETEVAVHKDMNDRNQTVKVTAGPATGDRLPYLAGAGALLILIAAGISLAARRKKK